MLILICLFIFSGAKLGIAWKDNKRTLYKLSNQTLPPAPKTANDITNAYLDEFVRTNYGMTYRDDKTKSTMFFKTAYQCEDYSYCIFSSDDVSHNIHLYVPTNNRKYYIDGTFQIVPMGDFKQVLTISIDFLGQVHHLYEDKNSKLYNFISFSLLSKNIPFVFVLMDRETTSAYTAVFKKTSCH